MMAGKEPLSKALVKNKLASFLFICLLCLLNRDGRKGEGWWEASGRSWEKRNHHQNKLYEKYYVQFQKVARIK